jgi:hypothetical protein
MTKKKGMHLRNNKIAGSKEKLSVDAVKVLAIVKFAPASLSREDIQDKTSLSVQDVERHVKLLLGLKLIQMSTKFPSFPSQGWRVYTEQSKHYYIIELLKRQGYTDSRVIETKRILGTYYPTDMELEGLGPQRDQGRTYPPGKPYIPELKFRPETIAVMVKFRDDIKPFKPKEFSNANVEEKKKKWKWFVDNMSLAYQIPIPTVNFGIFTEESWKEKGASGSSNYNHITHTLTFMGRFSIVTLFHEFAHARGFDETDAVIWSINLGLRYFPITFNRMMDTNPGSHLMTRDDVNREFTGD